LSALDGVLNSRVISRRRTRTWLWRFHYLWLKSTCTFWWTFSWNWLRFHSDRLCEWVSLLD